MRRSRHSPYLGRVACTAVLLLAGLVFAPASNAQAPADPDRTPSDPDPPAVHKPHPREKTLIKREWGVELRGVRLTAAGHMVEFRYKVLDAEKSAPLFDRMTKPYLVHEASGAALAVPVPAKVGPLRNSDPPVEGRVYWMFFGNPAGLVKAGDTVSVVIGEFRADRLVVE